MTLPFKDQYYLALIGVISAKNLRLALELQIHGFEKYSGLRKIIAGFCHTKSKRYQMCGSQRLKKQLMSEFGVKEEKITVVPIYKGKTQFPISNFQFPNKDKKCKILFLTKKLSSVGENISLQ